MTHDGKKLESLVSFVENTLMPEGISVTTNDKIFNDEGIQIAEFDIEVRGKLGSMDFSWLIECRDRPSSGPAPGSWIEQLLGRRIRFGFNKVTAVSTTGFSEGAKEFAISSGIELREVRALSPEEFSDWFLISHMSQIVREHSLLNAQLLMDGNQSQKIQREFAELIKKIDTNTAFLKSSQANEVLTPTQAFIGAVSGLDNAFADVEPNGEAKKIGLQANYTDESYFTVSTKAGDAKIVSIVFDGELRIKETTIPITSSSEYRKTESNEVISQSVSFAPQSIQGINFSTELHKMSETGETHVILRRLDDEA